jgi:hypothetical protein
MSKHIRPEQTDFRVVATDDSCIEITISNELDISSASLRILGENRNFLAEIKELENSMKFCAYTGRPMFAELHTPGGVSVHYVEGSGKDFYQ